MWTMDVIEALQALESAIGSAVCFEKVIPMAGGIVIKMGSYDRRGIPIYYTYDLAEKKIRRNSALMDEEED